MEEETNEVAYARSTWKKVKNFQEGLKDLETKIPMILVREYISTGKKNKDIPDEVYEQIDNLKNLRSNGIQGEMKYAVAQAEGNGIRLKENIIKGNDMRPGFSKKILNKIPSLGIYTHFMWYTEKELSQLREENQKPKGLQLENMEVADVDLEHNSNNITERDEGEGPEL